MGFVQLYPFVASVFQPTALHSGAWPDGKPLGITVHHAADRDLERVFQDGIKEKVGYHLIVDRDGKVHQTAYMDQRVNHAGDAEWNGHSPNRTHVAVCVLSWGRVSYTPSGLVVWAKGQPLLPPAECAMRRSNLEAKLAWWDACTPEQEVGLHSVLRWLIVTAKMDVKNVCGHDECALPHGRKDDPGGALSQTMADMRKQLMGVGKGA